LEIYNYTTDQVAAEKNIVVLPPHKHCEYISEAYVDVGNAQMKYVEVHASQFVFAEAGFVATAQKNSENNN